MKKSFFFQLEPREKTRIYPIPCSDTFLSKTTGIYSVAALFVNWVNTYQTKPLVFVPIPSTNPSNNIHVLHFSDTIINRKCVTNQALRVWQISGATLSSLSQGQVICRYICAWKTRTCVVRFISDRFKISSPSFDKMRECISVHVGQVTESWKCLCNLVDVDCHDVSFRLEFRWATPAGSSTAWSTAFRLDRDLSLCVAVA